MGIETIVWKPWRGLEKSMFPWTVKEFFFESDFERLVFVVGSASLFTFVCENLLKLEYQSWKRKSWIWVLKKKQKRDASPGPKPHWRKSIPSEKISYYRVVFHHIFSSRSWTRPFLEPSLVLFDQSGRKLPVGTTFAWSRLFWTNIIRFKIFLMQTTMCFVVRVMRIGIKINHILAQDHPS